MTPCKLVISDAVNARFYGVDQVTRKKMYDALKFFIPKAIHSDAYKFGRWDGTVSYCTTGGATYINLLDKIIPILEKAGYSTDEMELVDERTMFAPELPHIDANFLSRYTWPQGHRLEGQPIVLEEHQVRTINNCVDHPQSLQSVCTGAGKAQPLWSKILTPTGWINMGDVRVGDTLTAHDGTLTRVLGIYPQGLKDIYRITFADGRTAVSTDEHLWRVRRDGEDMVVTLAEIIAHTECVWSVPLFSPGTDHIDHIRTQIKSIIGCSSGSDLVSRETARTLQELVWSSGGICRLTDEDADNVECSIWYPTTCDENACLGITSIVPIGVDECQCIMVDHPDHLYVTDNYVVTHNTVTTAALAHLCDPHGRTIVIVPNKDLVRQTEADFLLTGLDVGVFYGDRKDVGKKHVICTWQSLNVLDKNSKNGGKVLRGQTGLTKMEIDTFLDGVVAVVVDEVHQATGSVLKGLLTGPFAHIPVRWGLTGTIPQEEYDFFALLSAIGQVVGEVSAKELQEKGFLAGCHIDILQMIETVEFSDWQDELSYLTSDEKRLKYIASMINVISDGGNTLVLVDRLEAGKKLSKYLNDAVFVSGSMKSKDRADEYKSINSATNKIVIATYGVAAVGISINRIFNLVLLEAGKSFVRTIQSIGRGLRKAIDKDSVNIYDVCSSTKFSKRHLTKRKSYYKDAGYKFTVSKVVWN